MEKLKISVCTVVLNEEKTIEKLLESLISQTLKPLEIIIVDGGSRDNTINIIKKFQKKYPFIKLYVKKSNIPQARNFAIEKARGDLIALIDAGCFAKKDWLEDLAKILQEKKADIASSLYEMKAKTPLQKAFSLFVGTAKEKFDEKSFIPSTRSVLFKKEVWEKLGGFNENLSIGEDHEFFLRAKRAGFRFANISDPKVVWFDFENLNTIEMIKKFFNYAKGDAKTLIFWNKTKNLSTHNLKILFIFLRYTILLLAFLLEKRLFFLFLLLYLFFSFLKFPKTRLSLKTRLCLPFVQLISDFSVMLGFLKGLQEKLLK